MVTTVPLAEPSTKVEALPAPVMVRERSMTTRSAYVPSATEMVSPETDCVIAYPIVRHGFTEQSPVSEPLVATWRTVAALAGIAPSQARHAASTRMARALG